MSKKQNLACDGRTQHMQQLNLKLSIRRLERVAGIEPAYSAWKAEVLPLNYARLTRTPKANKPNL
jgi:hypothetical protein